MLDTICLLTTGPLVPDAPGAGDRQMLDALGIPDFTPVPVRSRSDGWTPQKQRRFLLKLADCGLVSRAASAVGMTAKSAYRLRERPDAEDFRSAWDVLVIVKGSEITSFLLDRTIEGELVPVMYRGRQIGVRKTHNVRELVRLMRAFEREEERIFNSPPRPDAAATTSAGKPRKSRKRGL